MRPRHLLATALAALLVLACSAAPPSVSPSAAPTGIPATATAVRLTPTAAPTATAAPTVAPTTTAVPTPPGARVVTSDDGLLTIEIPAGALAEPVDIAVTALAAADLPPGLADLAAEITGYRLEPDGLEFLLPVTITRTILLPIGGDPMHDGVPVPRMATRSAAGI